MKVAELWRYPVKGAGGERLAATVLGPQGIAGDRALAVRDDSSGEVTWAGGTPAFMRLRAAMSAEGLVSVAPAQGPAVTDGAARDRLLSDAAGTEMSVVDFQPYEASNVIHLLSTASLRSLARALPDTGIEVTRFRPNILVDTDGDGFPEHEWIGRTVRVGEATLRITMGCVRCVMINQATLHSGFDERVLRWVAQNLRNILGVYAAVETPGAVAEGDDVTLGSWG